MTQFLADRVAETSTSMGAGPYKLLGALNNNCQSALSAGVVDGSVYEYSAHDPVNGGFETGLGTWGTGGILTRTTIYASSNAGAAVVWPAGTRHVALTLTAATLAALLTATGATLINGATRLIQTQRIMAQLVLNGQVQ